MSKSKDNIIIWEKWRDPFGLEDSDIEELIVYHKADIMVKGSDYRDKDIVGLEVCKKLIFFEKLDEYSTTKKIQDIISR